MSAGFHLSVFDFVGAEALQAEAHDLAYTPLDDVLPLLYECGFRWVRSLDFNELALEMLGDYKREWMFRFQHIALAAVRTPVANWP